MKALQAADVVWFSKKPPQGTPSMSIDSRVKLNDGSPLTLALYITPTLRMEQLVATNERLYGLPEEGCKLWKRLSDSEDIYPALAPLNGAVYLKPTSKGDDLVYKGLISVSDSLLRTVASSLRTQHSDQGFFEKAPVGVSFNSTFVGPGAEPAPLVAEHRQHSQLSWDYIPDVDLSVSAPMFAKALDDWFGAEGQDKARCLGEFAGLALMGGFGPSDLGRANIHTAVMNLGEGANGKSVFLSLLSSMIPLEYVSNVSPQDMGHEYNRDQLSGKRVNICPELPEREVISTGHLKSIIACDPGQTARQPYAKPYSFQPIAGHIFSANTLPRFSDSSGGFLRRWVIVDWPNVIAEGARDPQLCKKLIDQEGAAIASWFVQRGLEAFARGSLTVPKGSDDLKSQWLGDSDQVVEFVQGELVPIDEVVGQRDWTPVSDIYSLYKQWCETSGNRTVLRERHFYQRLRRAVGGAVVQAGGKQRVPYRAKPVENQRPF